MRILGLFNGLSGGQLALDRAGLEYSEYRSSEIDRYAVEVNDKNYPNTTQLGDVTKIDFNKHKDIDILLGGSPCQGFSRIGSRLGFKDDRSKLVMYFVEALNTIKPKYFLLENVVMDEASCNEISRLVGVEPVEINSSNFVPQKRVRLYWTNIPINPITPVGYNVEDFFDGPGFPSSCNQKRIFTKKAIFNTLTASYYKGIRASSRPAVSIKEGFLDDDRAAHRMLTPEECEKIQGVPVGYTNHVSKTQRYKMLGNGWEINTITHILKGIFTV